MLKGTDVENGVSGRAYWRIDQDDEARAGTVLSQSARREADNVDIDINTGDIKIGGESVGHVTYVK